MSSMIWTSRKVALRISSHSSTPLHLTLPERQYSIRPYLLMSAQGIIPSFLAVEVRAVPHRAEVDEGFVIPGFCLPPVSPILDVSHVERVGYRGVGEHAEC